MLRDIERGAPIEADHIVGDLIRRTGLKVIRVAINDDQIAGYDLATIAAKRKPNDPRRVRFRQTHGGFDAAVEIEAMDPVDLRALYDAAIADYWDDDAYQAVLDREAEDRRRLGFDDGDDT